MTAQPIDGRHGASVTRIENIKRLIANLRVIPMSRDEIGVFLNFSPSGVRKYVQFLRDANVVEVLGREGATRNYEGVPIYGVSDNAPRVDAFLATLTSARKHPPRSQPERSQVAIASRNPNRHFHIMRDDSNYPVRVPRDQVKSDPLALPREFFAARVGV